LAADLHPLKMAYRFEIEHLITLKNGNKSILVEMGIEFCDDLWREIKSYLFEAESFIFWRALRRTIDYRWAQQYHNHSGNFNKARERNPNFKLIDFAKKKHWKPYINTWIKNQVQHWFKANLTDNINAVKREELAYLDPTEFEDFDTERWSKYKKRKALEEMNACIEKGKELDAVKLEIRK